MKTNDIKIIKQTFQEIADIVTPTMGAKGRLAVIQQDMDRPLLTDDGVTVARQTYNLDDPDFQKKQQAVQFVLNLGG